MNRFFKSNSSVSSKSSIAKIPEIVNEEQVEYQSDDYLIDFDDWNIPKVPSKEIYRKKWLTTSFRSEHHVKIVEQVYAINKEHEICQLFSPEAIRKQRSDGYNFIHIGLGQVAVKPLTRRGLNALTC
jgi:sulfur relay (sulfurtransferase) DsrC/TusE family protein